MLSLQQLKGQIAAYASGNVSLGEFQDWLAENSIDPLASGELEDLVFSVESALSERHFGGLGQQKLRTKLQELANAVRPLPLRGEVVRAVSEEIGIVFPVTDVRKEQPFGNVIEGSSSSSLQAYVPGKRLVIPDAAYSFKGAVAQSEA